MAITGYEVDQVVLNHRPSPSTNQGRQHIIFAPQRNIYIQGDPHRWRESQSGLRKLKRGGS